MKGEYVEDPDDHRHNHHNHPIFSKFPPHQIQTQPHKFQPHNFPSSHSFPSAARDSEEAESPALITTVTPLSSKKPRTTTDDGATVEVTRRPRGRPPGSKNKPKPPVVINREPEPPMAPCILEVPSGSDIVESLTRFTRRRCMGLCVLTASGAVANVTLKQPSAAAPGGTVTFHGRFDILSLSAVILLETLPFLFCGNTNNGNGERFGFTISLAGPQGQIVGGKVVEPLIAAGTVYVIAASFNCPSYHRLPVEDQDQMENPSAGGDGQSGSPVSGGGSGGGGSGGGTMGTYGCHVGSASSDVIWAPTARPPLPPPY